MHVDGLDEGVKLPFILYCYEYVEGELSSPNDYILCLQVG